MFKMCVCVLWYVFVCTCIHVQVRKYMHVRYILHVCVCVCVCVCGRPTQISQQVRRQYKTMNQISEKKKTVFERDGQEGGPRSQQA